MPDSLVYGLDGGLLDYLERGNRVRVAKKSRVAYCTAIDIIGTNGKPIALCESIGNLTIQRNLKVIRHLNSVDAGSGIEINPGVVTIDFTLNSMVLWPADDGTPNTLSNRLMQEPDIMPGVISDTEYFDVGIVFNHPYAAKASYTLWFLNCMIKSLTVGNMGPFDSQNYMTESASITALRTGYSSAASTHS
jgi:hypothetical protein